MRVLSPPLSQGGGRGKFVLLTALFLALLPSISSSFSATATSEADLEKVKKLLREGDKLLLKGRSSYQDAIAKYSAAIAMDDSHPSSYLRRADLYYLMKENSKSTADLSKLLELDPKNKQGLTLRAKQNAAAGNVAAASADYIRVAQLHRQNNDHKKAEKMQREGNDLARLASAWSSVQEGFDRIGKMHPSEKIELGQQCMPIVTDILTKYATSNMQMRTKKAECAMMAHDPAAAADTLKFILNKEPDNLGAIAMNARSLRGLGATDAAKKEVRRCLTLDPEFAPCVAAHKAMKKFGTAFDKLKKGVDQKRWKDVPALVEEVRGVEADPPQLEEIMNWWCEAETENRNAEKAFDACEYAIESLGGEKNPGNLDNFLRMADIFIMQEDLQSAEKWINIAGEAKKDEQKVRQYREKLERLKKAANMKNYYKILGVKKTANDQEIHRAFRKMARDRHPDRLRSRDDLTERQKERMGKEFSDINEAKEVLLDSEKRRRYDAGEDPTKPPEQQGGGHHHHFHHGGFPGGGFPGGNPFGGGGGGGGGGFNFHFG